MAKSKRTSKSDKEAHVRYERESRWAINRRASLARHLKKQPNDLVAKSALENIKYRRKKPKASCWTGATKAIAQLMKEFKVPEPKTRERIGKFDLSLSRRARLVQ